MSERDWAFLVGGMGVLAVLLLVTGLVSWPIAFIGAAWTTGWAYSKTVIETWVAGTAVVIVAVGVALLVAASAFERIARGLAEISKSVPGAKQFANAVVAGAEATKRPDTWVLILSAAFVSLAEITKDLDDQPSIKLLVYIALVAAAVFTFCYQRRSNLAYKIAAFTVLVGVPVGCASAAFHYDSGHFVPSDAGRAFGEEVLGVVHKPHGVPLLILPMLVALASFFSIFEDKAPAKA